MVQMAHGLHARTGRSGRVVYRTCLENRSAARYREFESHLLRMFLGLDYGLKKIGIAYSDSGETIAFPHTVIPTDKQALTSIKAFCNEKAVSHIVVGDTRTASGRANTVTPQLEEFVHALGKIVTCPITIVPEHGTTGASRRIYEEHSPRGAIATQKKVHDTAHDARAAAFILQRFLDGMHPVVE